MSENKQDFSIQDVDIEEIKESIMALIDYLSNSESFQKHVQTQGLLKPPHGGTLS